MVQASVFHGITSCVALLYWRNCDRQAKIVQRSDGSKPSDRYHSVRAIGGTILKFKITIMVVQDILLLIKKIVVGFIIFILPLFIIAAVLWLIQNRILN